MKADKIDRRVQYTHMVLKQSLLDLMATQPIRSITVTEICDRANINRGTFYVHYADQYDLLAQIEDDLDDVIQATLEKRLPSSDVTVEILRTIATQSSLCKVLFSEFGDAAFLKKIMYNAHDQFIGEWTAKVRPDDAGQLDRFYVFIANGISAVIQDWLQDGMPDTPEALAAFIQKAIDHGLSAFVS